jgi:hypothetical protein
MLSLQEADLATLQWSSKGQRMNPILYSLRDGNGSEHVAATLQWERRDAALILSLGWYLLLLGRLLSRVRVPEMGGG